jgi:hypothetical protein
MLGRVPGGMPARPLVVYVVWHPRYARGSELAGALFEALCADPRTPGVRGIGIPVFFRTSNNDEAAPLEIPVDDASHTAVLALVDDELICANAYQNYLVETRHRLRPGVDTLQLIPLTSSMAGLDPGLADLQAKSLSLSPDDASLRELALAMTNRVMAGLCRLMGAAEKHVRVFISHSHQDGAGVARTVHDYLAGEADFHQFLDAASIEDGTRFADRITDEMNGSSVLLVVHTDTYGSREWCRLEVLEAKRRFIAVVVLTRVEIGEVRAFPYMGNVPVVRCQNRPEQSMPALAHALLREVLRARYFPSRVQAIVPQRAVRRGKDSAAVPFEVFSYPPELLTAVLLRKRALDDQGPAGLYVYPDPPLGTEELQLVRDAFPELRPVTPTMLLVHDYGL